MAVGSAWSAVLRGTDQVSVAFFGDGATNIGAFHEAINLAAVWKLPVLFVCENNLYMEYTPISEVTAVANPAADRAPAYGLEGILVDGNDPDAMFAVAGEAIGRARSGQGPSLIEAKTYRQSGHSRADPGKYRPDEEVAAWLARDPIPTYRARLLADGVSETTLAEVDSVIAAEVERAIDEAKASPEPDGSSLQTQLYADGGSSWRN
jgi:pyruvate dehydrogenase E1 component alpha subunit